MKVLVLVPGNDLGGAERVAAHVAATAVERGHVVTIGAPRHGRLGHGIEQHPVVDMDLYPSRKHLGVRAVRQIRAHESDVVFSIHRWTTLLAGVAWRSGGAPVAFHAGSMVGRRVGTWWGNVTIAVSEAIRDHVVRCGAHPDRTIVVHHGAEVRDPPARTPGERRLVAAARFVPGKGIDHLLRAMADLQNFSLTVLGDGPQGEQLQRMAAERGLEGRVTFPGWVDDPWDAYGAADIGIVPSSVPEGLGLAATEMMMAGLPVVVTDVPGLREVADGDGVRLAPAGDPAGLRVAILSISREDPEDLGRHARARALKHFNANTAAERIVDELECVAGGLR